MVVKEEMEQNMATLTKDKEESMERAKILLKERDAQSDLAKSLKNEKDKLVAELKYWENLAADVQRERDARSKQTAELEQAFSALQLVYGVEGESVEDWLQLADNLKKERDNYTDSVKSWEKMVADLQIERDSLAEKFNKQVEAQREMYTDKEVNRREKELRDDKLKELVRTIADLTNEKEMVQRELQRESKKDRERTVYEKGKIFPSSLDTPSPPPPLPSLPVIN